MPEQTTPSPAEQQKMLEEAKQKFDAAKAQLDRGAAKARDGWAARIQHLKQELAAANDMRGAAEERRAKLEPLKDERPEALELFTRMQLLIAVNTHAAKMKEREIACYEHCISIVDNLPQLDTDPPPAVPHFPLPGEDLAYLEARSRFDVATMAYHWMRNREGLEAILRASGNEPALGGSEADEQVRKARVDAVRNEMRQDKDFMILITKLGQDLNEAKALLEWANSSLQTLGQLPEGPRRQALADTDWAKLNNAVQTVIAVPERVNRYASLAKLFPAIEKPAAR